jgi:hypothetical protein
MSYAVQAGVERMRSPPRCNSWCRARRSALPLESGSMADEGQEGVATTPVPGRRDDRAMHVFELAIAAAALVAAVLLALAR